MSGKTITISGKFLFIFFGVILISLIVLKKLFNTNSDKEEIIRENVIPNQQNKVNETQQESKISWEEKNREEKTRKAEELRQLMLKHMPKVDNLKIYPNKRQISIGKCSIPFDGVNIFYTYNDSQPQFGVDYITFKCISGTCISCDWNVQALSFPISSKNVVNEIVSKLDEL